MCVAGVLQVSVLSRGCLDDCPTYFTYLLVFGTRNAARLVKGKIPLGILCATYYLAYLFVFGGTRNAARLVKEKIPLGILCTAYYQFSFLLLRLFGNRVYALHRLATCFLLDLLPTPRFCLSVALACQSLLQHGRTHLKKKGGKLEAGGN